MNDAASTSDSNSPPRLLLVDGHAYAYRAFYAIRHLRSPTGQPTNAVYGFIKMLGKLLAGFRPSHAAVVWDGGLAKERQILLPEYKSQRPEMPADLAFQFDEIVSYLEACRIHSYRGDGVEADDWIATLARRSSSAGLNVVIASSDKDFMQLVGPTVGLINPSDKSEKIWTAEDVRAKTGVEPTQIVDWLSLIGDAVDNIPGVAGVGPKTATELLQRFGSIDDLLNRLPEVKSIRLREKLAESGELLRRNQRMIRLHDDLPGEFRSEAFTLTTAITASLLKLYSRWGFRTLLQELEKTLEAGPLPDLFGKQNES